MFVWDSVAGDVGRGGSGVGAHLTPTNSIITTGLEPQSGDFE